MLDWSALRDLGAKIALAKGPLRFAAFDPSKAQIPDCGVPPSLLHPIRHGPNRHYYSTAVPAPCLRALVLGLWRTFGAYPKRSPEFDRATRADDGVLDVHEREHFAARFERYTCATDLTPIELARCVANLPPMRLRKRTCDPAALRSLLDWQAARAGHPGLILALYPRVDSWSRSDWLLNIAAGPVYDPEPFERRQIMMILDAMAHDPDIVGGRHNSGCPAPARERLQLWCEKLERLPLFPEDKVSVANPESKDDASPAPVTSASAAPGRPPAPRPKLSRGPIIHVGQGVARAKEEDPFAYTRAVLSKDGIPLVEYRDDTLDRIEALQALYPWMAPIIQSVRQQLTVGRRFLPHAGVVIRPLLLVGPPGIGKTSFLLALARALRMPKLVVSGATDTFGNTLVGSARQWRASRPSAVVTRMAEVNCGNLIVVVDEVDKGVVESSNGSFQDSVMSVSDRAVNRAWRDICLEVDVDLSGISWLATANQEHRLSPPLLDRFQIMRPDEIKPSHAGAVLSGLRAELARQWGVPEADLPAFNDFHLAEVRKHIEQGLRLRGIGRRVEGWLLTSIQSEDRSSAVAIAAPAASVEAVSDKLDCAPPLG